MYGISGTDTEEQDRRTRHRAANTKLFVGGKTENMLVEPEEHRTDPNTYCLYALLMFRDRLTFDLCAVQLRSSRQYSRRLWVDQNDHGVIVVFILHLKSINTERNCNIHTLSKEY